ncbi:MAG: hypothetical protein FJY73_01300 [Candidatus Eisenbacteria bacterium]|nr:hypothetical protein [Candidatus Eisenbacteria bacterium]
MRHRKRSSRGIVLLDLAVVAALLVLVVFIQVAVYHRNAEIRREQDSRKRMKWIAKAQELYFTENARYASRFRQLTPYVRDVDTFVCPVTGELFSLWIDDLGRYQLESPAGHGSILSGEPDWE